MDVMETKFLYGLSFGHLCINLTPKLAIGKRNVVRVPKIPVAGLTIPERLLITIGIRDFILRIRRNLLIPQDIWF